MKLQSSNGNSFDLRILGYQFPQIHDEPYDANWLFIEIAATHPNGSWRAQDASLLTFEVSALSEWLRRYDQTDHPNQCCEFIEPNLKFRLSDDRATLSVYFDLELLPDWIPDKYDRETELFIEFPVAELNLQSAADDLDKQLLQFPERALRNQN
ncbi:MAG: hypothetical protein ACK56D_02645 [Planctomycetota bacterium]|jgi:hypothetical protein